MSLNLINQVDGSTKLIAGGTLYANAPIGTISPFGGSIIPGGYLLCDGAELLKTDYAELYTVIGDAFGTASDNTKFVLPDFREAVPKGAGLQGLNTVGAHLDADGLTVGEFLDDRIQNHLHNGLTLTDGTGIKTIANTVPTGSGSGLAIATGTTDFKSGAVSSNYRYGATTEVKSVGVNYIIKAKQIPIPADIMDAVSEIYATKEYVDEVQVVDLSNYISSSVTLAANGAHAYIHGKHVEIVAHINKASASAIGGFPVITGINALIPMPKDGGFIVGSLYAAQGSNYYSGFCGYNKTSDSLGIYLAQAAAANTLFQININYIGE